MCQLATYCCRDKYKLTKSDPKGVLAEATANAEQVNDRCKPSLEEARNYVFAQSPKSQKSKQSTKRSKTSSKAHALVELQLEQEELERQGAEKVIRS